LKNAYLHMDKGIYHHCKLDDDIEQSIREKNNIPTEVSIGNYLFDKLCGTQNDEEIKGILQNFIPKDKENTRFYLHYGAEKTGEGHKYGSITICRSTLNALSELRRKPISPDVVPLPITKKKVLIVIDDGESIGQPLGGIPAKDRIIILKHLNIPEEILRNELCNGEGKLKDVMDGKSEFDHNGMDVVTLKNSKVSEFMECLPLVTDNDIYEIIVFFSGHGDRKGLVLQSEYLFYQDIIDRLNEYYSPGKPSHSFLFVFDCCLVGNSLSFGFRLKNPSVFQISAVAVDEEEIQYQHGFLAFALDNVCGKGYDLFNLLKEEEFQQKSVHLQVHYDIARRYFGNSDYSKCHPEFYCDLKAPEFQHFNQVPRSENDNTTCAYDAVFRFHQKDFLDQYIN